MIGNILLVLLLLLLSSKIVGSIFQKIGLDTTIGELLTGIIFGPFVLKFIGPESIEPFAIIGYVLILFIAGMKQQDVGEIYKDKPALKIGLTLLIVTALLMSAFFYFIPAYFGINLTLLQAIVLGLAFAIIDIGVPAKVLISKGLINLPVGRIIVRSAIVNIIMGLCLFTLLTLFITPGLADIIIKAAGVLLFLGLTV
ncbi:hypothetical protein COV22_04610, partial [Candidatus Woesearchaeota archaeon CG10_big_fil_rev_8_21_14_0_10_47_5]